ncbi:helix-turn-helix domain-containing protein [uncultured Roseivirga sp.]|mgnify:FL=1|uniref:helix-turn-helix domain-containing protein n=1 Tax=uncultured Roseivirga sp. TaxID=543088 RepID=UPI0030D9E688|tara:strand:+ start:57549 stop:57818 length:270 start_codon:yes stop_codon:yes gene_type:complete
MEIICLEEKAFYALVERVVDHLKQTHSVERDKWISADDALKLLDVKSKTTLQRMRDDGRIRFSQPQKKIILYDRDSIIEYLEENAQDRF